MFSLSLNQLSWVGSGQSFYYLLIDGVGSDPVKGLIIT